MKIVDKTGKLELQLGIRNLKFEIATAKSFHIPNYKFHIAVADGAEIFTTEDAT